MNLDEYFERNPGTIEKIKAGKYRRDTWERMFPDVSAVAWSSFVTFHLMKAGKAFLAPVRSNVRYTEMSLEEYDEQLAINQKFQRMYIQEKREKELRKAAAEYDCC